MIDLDEGIINDLDLLKNAYLFEFGELEREVVRNKRIKVNRDIILHNAHIYSQIYSNILQIEKLLKDKHEYNLREFNSRVNACIKYLEFE